MPDDTATVVSYKGQIILDATARPQDIAYPTDLNLLSEARGILEQLIVLISDKGLHKTKPKTYCEIALVKYQKLPKNRAINRMP